MPRRKELSLKELELLECFACGVKYSKLREALKVKERELRELHHSLYRKLNATCREAAISMGYIRGFLRPGRMRRLHKSFTGKYFGRPHC